MITLQQALEIQSQHIFLQKTEKIPLSLSINRVLAENLLSGSDFPPFNKAAVDGYACQKSDLPGTLQVIGTVRAGYIANKKVEKGTCIKIMTGAKAPEGADCIVMVEDVEKIDDDVIKTESDGKKSNICLQGEDLKKGGLILKKGTLISGKHIGPLASGGFHQVEVYRQPVVTVFSTGAELVEPEDIPMEGQIRNSNGSQLVAQLATMGINGIYGGITDDDEEIMQVELSRSIENFDGIILSGGVSAGDYDLVPHVLVSMGFKIQFHKLKIKPGKPVLFATKGDKFCFGMPGNPVSSFVQFEMLVKPYLYSLMGHNFKPVELKSMAGETISRNNSEMEGYIPVKLNEEKEIVQVVYNGSGHIFALNETFGLLKMAIGMNKVEKGEWCYVRPV